MNKPEQDRGQDTAPVDTPVTPAEAETPNENPSIQAATVKRTRAFSIVWLVPIVALAVAIFLLFSYIRNNGTEITLYMPNADGIEVNKTQIKILNVEVGKVVDVRLNGEDGVILTAKVKATIADKLRKDSQFWIVKPRIDQSGVRGLDTLVSGSYIGFKPGQAEETKHEFVVSDNPPLDDLGDGLRLRLVSDKAKMLPVGAPILYEDLQVGQVQRVEFDSTTQKVRYDIFITKPNVVLVGSNVKFWIKSGVNIQTNSQGIQIDAAPMGSILSGAIAFTQPLNVGKGTPIKNGHEFHLNSSITDVIEPASGRAFYLVAFFDQSMRGLTAGSSVEYKGLPIGVVEQTPYFDNNDQVNLLENRYIPVKLRIEPAAIEMGAKELDPKEWQAKFDAAIRGGLYATMVSNNLVTGNMSVDLTDEASPDPSLRPHSVYGGHSVIPSRAVGMTATIKQLNRMLIKFNNLPLEKSVGELNANLAELKTTIKSVNTLLGSKDTQNIPKELNQTLNQLRQTLAGVSPDSPAYRDIQSTLQSLDRTLQKTDPLLRQLGEKPNALIFDNKSPDPIPKGR